MTGKIFTILFVLLLLSCPRDEVPEVGNPTLLDPLDAIKPDEGAGEEEPISGPPLCKNIYDRLGQIGEGKNSIVYEISATRKKTRNARVPQCWSLKCEAVVVKETPSTQIGNNVISFSKKAGELGVALPLLGSGECNAEGRLINYLITRKIAPILADDALFTDKKQFSDSVFALLNNLHSAGIIHGDIHLGNLLKDPTSNSIFLTDFDKSFSVEGKSEQDKLGYIAFENFSAHKLWEIVEPWQPFVYRYIFFDWDRNGTISDKELDLFASSIGSYEKAQALAELYAFRMMMFDESFKRCLYEDFDRSGTIESSEVSNISQDCKNTYQRIVADLKAASSYALGPIGSRVISDDGRYTKEPLTSGQVLIISGGDITPKRSFPKLTAENFKQYSEIQGYRFEHNNKNLAYPFTGYWHKIFMLIDKLSFPENRIVVWFDDDGIVDVESDMLEQYLKAYPKKDIIIATDPEYYAYVNSGALIVRNTTNSIVFLNEVLKVGKEGRINRTEYERNWYSSNHLLTCKQDFFCLHEQQAMQEILQKRKRVYSQGRDWHQSKIVPRDVPFDAHAIVEIVPQIDLQTGRNMNFLLSKGSDSLLQGRYEIETENKTIYRDIGFPFFVQCAGPQDKETCIRNVLADRALKKKHERH